MPETFGARLRQRREERQIDLVAIAVQTKIKLSLLEGLERDDVSHWPSGIFRRAYIRSYAQFLDLDPDVLLREFLAAHPDHGDTFTATTAAAAAAEEAAREVTGPPARLRSLVDSAFGSLAKLRRPGGTEDHVPAVPPPAPAAPLPVEQSTATSEVAAPKWGRRMDDDVAQVRRVPRPSHTFAGAPALWSERPAAEPVVEPGAEAKALDTEASLGTNVAKAAEAPEQSKETASLGDLEREAAAAAAQASFDSRLEALALLCTEFGRVVERTEVQQLLGDAAHALDATGLIVWLWDDTAEALRPALVHGYPDKVLAQLPMVKRDGDNATAEAFRTARECEVVSSAHASGALVVPLLIPEGCAGVLAVELQQGIELSRSIRAVAAVLAAAVTQLVFRSTPASQQRPESEEALPPAPKYRPPLRPAKVRR